MKLTNETDFMAGWNVGFQPDGREVIVLIVKATYSLLEGNDQIPVLAQAQQSLNEADTFGADPANDAPIHENDFALFKPACDILLRAKAHAPGRRPAKRVGVGFQVGDCHKRFMVVGQRSWQRGAVGVSASQPEPFESVDITYDVAFGGTDIDPKHPEHVRTYLQNPVGTGYCCFKANIDGMPLPITEEIGRAVTSPTDNYKPMALGPLGRNWQPRYPYAGTYDEDWQINKLPFLPDDFDFRYFQAAPLDQQIPYPRGGEPIALFNLSPGGRLTSKLPTASVFVSFLRYKGQSVEVQANMDTLTIEPEEHQMCLTWRAQCSLHRDMFELREMIVETGENRRQGRVRARLKDKTYYDSLSGMKLRPGGSK